MRFKVGLALSGGGVRGLAHIGALKVLKENNVPIELVVGTSMGAIVGAAFCLYGDIETAQEKIGKLLESQHLKRLEVFLAETEIEEKKLMIEELFEFIKEMYLWNIKKIKGYLADIRPIAELIESLIPKDIEFKDLKIPFACTAVDLISGEDLLLNKGEVARCVLASCAIPGVFPPVYIEGRQLIDGGILSLLPSRQVRCLGADFVLGVNAEAFRMKFNIASGIEAVFQADQIRAQRLNQLDLAYCDFAIRPRVEKISWSEFSKGQQCILMGQEAALRDIATLKKALRKARLKLYLPRPLRRLLPAYTRPQLSTY
jgi:NTE family protein